MAQLAARDGALVHLVGPVGQPQGAQVGVGHGEREVVGDAGAAVHLDGAVDDLQRDVRGGDLDRRDLGPRFLVADRVHQVGGLEREQPDHLDVDARLGNPVLDVGVVGDRLAEGDPGLGAFAHQLQRALGHADGPHAVVDPAGPEPGLADREALTLTLEHVLGGHPHVGELDLGVALAVL